MIKTDIDQAKQNFRELLERTFSTGEIIITKEERPLVKIIPIKQPRKERKFGSAKGLIKFSDDFANPIEDFKEYM